MLETALTGLMMQCSWVTYFGIWLPTMWLRC